MDLSDAKITPAEGMLVVRFIDDEPDDEQPSTDASVPSEPIPYEGCLATVVACGAKTAPWKKGQVVVTDRWARDGLMIGEDLHLIYGHCVKASLSL